MRDRDHCIECGDLIFGSQAAIGYAKPCCDGYQGQGLFQVVRTPGWVVYGEFSSRERAQAWIDQSETLDEGGSLFVHEPGKAAASLRYPQWVK